MEEKKWWESSVDAGKLALRIRGVLVAIIPLIILTAQLSGVQVEEQGLQAVVDAIVNMVLAIGVAVGITMSIIGHIRRKK